MSARAVVLLVLLSACGAGISGSGLGSGSGSGSDSDSGSGSGSGSDSDSGTGTGTGTFTGGERCGGGMQEAAMRIYRMRPRDWADPALRALAACDALPAPLRQAAQEAIGRGIDERTRILGDAAAALAPPACRPDDPRAPAQSLAARCAFAEPVEWVHEWTDGIDAGVWLYLAVTARELAARGIVRGHGPPVLDQLWKGAAWERAENGPR